MNKIDIQNLHLIFGPKKKKAMQMLQAGKSKEEILRETDCTIAVKNANFQIKEGEIFVLMGLSGSGKSTLLRCLNRLINPTSGKILCNGQDIASLMSTFKKFDKPEDAAKAWVQAHQELVHSWIPAH